MSNNQNQGASIEAERADFEAWAELTDHQKRGAQHDVVGWYYFDEVTNDRWEAWQACTARRTPAAAAGAGELPPLTGSIAEALAMRDAEIADLRAQLAQYETDDAAHHRVHDKHGARILELEAQLAAKRQGEPVAIVADGYLGPHRAAKVFLGANVRIGDKLYLAAPASAQLADRCPHCDDTGDVHTPTGEWRGACSCPAGAQPDQQPAWPGGVHFTHITEGGEMSPAQRAEYRDHLHKLVESVSGKGKPLAHGHRSDYYLLANARRIGLLPIHQVVRMPNWALAHELFATGSTSAHQICVDAGIDPDATTMDRKELPRATTYHAQPLTSCAAGMDGDCGHPQCPQARDREPMTSGRHCPLDNQGTEE